MTLSCTSLTVFDHKWTPLLGQLGCCENLLLAEAASLDGSELAGLGLHTFLLHGGRDMLLTSLFSLQNVYTFQFSDFSGTISNLVLDPCKSKHACDPDLLAPWCLILGLYLQC